MPAGAPVLLEGGLESRRVRRTQSGPRRPRREYVARDSITCDEALNAGSALLPSNYSFEIHKTVWRVKSTGAKRVALQMPEGLLRFSCIIADIFQNHAGGADAVVMGGVTYSACCVDDFSAAALGCDFLVHYGHSCLVPVQGCLNPMLYVFAHISFELRHLVQCLKDNFPSTDRLALVGTIQLISTIHSIRGGS